MQLLSRSLPLLRLAAGLAACLAAGGSFAFGFDDVDRLAKAKAALPHVTAPLNLPPDLRGLSYDQYRDIRFKPDQAMWRADGLPFELAFFHLGKHQTAPVRIHEVTSSGAVRHITFDPKTFDYGKNKVNPANWGDLGFAGFRVHYALNKPTYKDELVVFLGASYFRALGRDQHYGLSARGLAIDTAGGKGEEFPRFTEFWIERPASNATSLVVHALLESPRATGAYQFTLRPGESTVADVRSRLYLRAGVATLGIAPLTSMFQHGENQPRAGEFRPEVHDSDGLMVATGEGEWLWRPLINPSKPLVTSFATRDPKGFGLMQRDRAFASYEDTEASYERRPSTWIEPKGAWGRAVSNSSSGPRPTRPTTTSWRTGCPTRCPPRASRSTSRTACRSRAMCSSARPPAGPPSRARAAASPRWRPTK